MRFFDLTVRLILVICGFAFAARMTGKITEGFTLTRIYSDHPFNPIWEVENPSSLEMKKIFDQPFTYLGAGGQCFAFVSEDGDYVLKFFKHHLRRLPIWKKNLPFQSIKAREIKLHQKLERDFASYKLAMERLAEETGLLYVHLNRSDSLHQTARIIDKLKIEHTVNLDEVGFILQKKATMAYTHFKHLVDAGDLEGGKEAIDSLCSLILTRCSQGIHDEDAKIHRNFGFIGNTAILIDGGRLLIDPKRLERATQFNDLAQITLRLKNYLEELSPELASYLNQRIEDQKVY